MWIHYVYIIVYLKQVGIDYMDVGTRICVFVESVSHHTPVSCGMGKCSKL